MIVLPQRANTPNHERQIKQTQPAGLQQSSLSQPRPIGRKLADPLLYLFWPAGHTESRTYPVLPPI